MNFEFYNRKFSHNQTHIRLLTFDKLVNFATIGKCKRLLGNIGKSQTIGLITTIKTLYLLLY